MEAMKPRSVRFEKDMDKLMEEAAKLEGLEVAAYIRRCAILYTREHHPELFSKS